LLYHEAGLLHSSDKKPKEAMKAWLDGIAKAPQYPENYYEAAEKNLTGDHIVAGLLYGEVFVNLTQDTTRANACKKMLFTGYKKMFDNMVAGKPDAPSVKQADAPGFESAVLSVYRTLTPVVSDGITTENLVMVRTRFLMDWGRLYGQQYPFTLFSWLDGLVRFGKFEIYNEWLFGAAESPDEYDAWNHFHEGDIDRFITWQATNKLIPVAEDAAIATGKKKD
jgi:hypothetical protein